MSNRRFGVAIVICGSICTAVLAFSQSSATPNDPATEPKTRPVISKTGNHYLRPDDFGSVPDYVRSQLSARHCLIRQDVETAGPTNLVTGEFSEAGQQDWAAYCSVEGKSKVIVIWGGRHIVKANHSD
jgi:hypothetical protein